MVKNKITYQDYFSKVYGCWLGKCIAGNVGAPYEGMKQKLSLKYTPEYLEKMLPNDDLDLQVLWLEVLRKKGEYFTSDDLAEIFAANCDYAPGEYAFSKKIIGAVYRHPMQEHSIMNIILTGWGRRSVQRSGRVSVRGTRHLQQSMRRWMQWSTILKILAL